MLESWCEKRKRDRQNFQPALKERTMIGLFLALKPFTPTPAWVLGRWLAMKQKRQGNKGPSEGWQWQCGTTLQSSSIPLPYTFSHVYYISSSHEIELVYTCEYYFLWRHNHIREARWKPWKWTKHHSPLSLCLHPYMFPNVYYTRTCTISA